MRNSLWRKPVLINDEKKAKWVPIYDLWKVGDVDVPAPTPSLTFFWICYLYQTIFHIQIPVHIVITRMKHNNLYEHTLGIVCVTYLFMK